MTRVFLLAATLASLEFAVLFPAIQPATSSGLLALLIVLHTLLCAASALLMQRMLPPNCREPQLAVVVLFFALAFFIPMVGGIALWLIIFAILRWPALAERQNFQALNPPEFTLQGDQINVRFGVGGVRARLADHQASSESRLEALLAIKAMPQRLSSSILRSLLDDPEEDLRLLAYGMLDSEEKNINEQINQALNEYRNAEGQKAGIARRLAFLYWELVYQNLVMGDVRSYALGEARQYADEALAAYPQDAGVWVLEGKILGAREDWDGAHAAFLRGQHLGYPSARLTPYLAEHAFRQRQFDQVKSLLQSMDTLTIADIMHPVISFWTTNENNHSGN